MPAPKDQGRNPVSMGIKFVKKANSWCVHQNFNQENVVDHMFWCDTEEQAKQKLEELRHDKA